MHKTIPTVTKHGKQRLKERVGLRGEAAKKNVQRALEHGLTMEETDGSLYKYLVHLYVTHGEIGHMRLYNYQIYCFDEEVLITVYNLPRQYANAFERARKKKAAPKGAATTQTKDERKEKPMDDLIIFSGGTEQFPVDCRVLHEQLKPKTPYRIWFPRQIEGVFVEGEDFTPNKNVRVQIEGKPHTCWTQKGRVFLYDLLKTDGILPLIERDQAMA